LLTTTRCNNWDCLPRVWKVWNLNNKQRNLQCCKRLAGATQVVVLPCRDVRR